MCLNPKKAYMINYIDDDGEWRRKAFFSLQSATDYLDDRLKVKFYDMQRFDRDDMVQTLDLPCGRCYECLRQKSVEWSYRCLHETRYHEDNCFVTLTYAVDPVTLVPRDLTLFIKRLRKSLDCKIKYFSCGEYGKKGHRPHYHLCLFGYKPKDLVYFFTTDSGDRIYKSKSLERLWNKGYVAVGLITQSSAMYCAKYLQKFNPVPTELVELPHYFVDDDGTVDMFMDYGFMHPAFIRVSKGLGLRVEDMDLNDKLYYRGKYIRYPRYYLKVLDKYGVDIDDLRDRRKQTNDVLFAVRTEESLKAKELKADDMAHRFGLDKKIYKGKRSKKNVKKTDF